MSNELDPNAEPEILEPHTTLAEFREDFPQKPKADEIPPPEPSAERQPRRRAKSHQADAEDVPEIAALTKQLREAEDAIKIERKEGESDRVFQLRKRAEIAKRAIAPPALQSPVVQQPPARVAAPPSEFTEKEPTIDQFAKEADPYAAWQRALGRYDRRKDEFDAKQEVAKASYEAQKQTFDREIAAGIQSHGQRINTFIQANPDAKALFEANGDMPLTLAIRGAVEFHEQGPQMMMALIKNQELADELFLLTDGRPIGDPRTDQLVATVRRRLLQRTSGVVSGSPAPPRQVKLAPRPPNPERTVPQTPREKSPSEAPGSLAEHRRAFPTTH